MARRKASRKKSSGIRKFGCLLFFLLLLVAVAGFIHQTPAVWNLISDFAQDRIVAVSKPKAPEEPQVEFSAPPAPAQNVQARYDNLSFGIPGKADTIIDREGYALGYIEYHEQPAWVIYKLTRVEATTKAAKRGNDFREDPQIPTGSATLADYRRSGYDRGHLAPAADMAFSVRTMSESFYLSNMSPQRPKFNRGVWKDLEEQVRRFAIAEGEIMVVTGPILPKTKSLTIGNNKVTVPTHYYKVIYDLMPPRKMIGFILPNEGSKRSLQDFTVTVDAVEAATGLDFFSLVPQPEQERMESTITIKDWRWSK